MHIRAKFFAGLVAAVGVLAATSAIPPAGAWVGGSGAPPWAARPPIHVARYHSGSPNLSVTNPNPQGYIPCDLRTAYQLGSVSGDGTGQTIAIVDAYSQPNITSDVAKFDAAFGLPAISLTVQPIGHVRGNQGWGLEESLDVEWAHAMAPGAKVVLVEASSASLTNLLSAVNYAVHTLHAPIVSMSWGGSEFSSESSYDSYFPTASGAAFTVSAGDSGAGAEWPSASPNVLSVGGTSLASSATGDLTNTHTVCSGNGVGATSSNQTAWSGSGGGLSQYEARPAYQSASNTYSSTQRGTPDIAWVGDPNTGVAVYDSYGDNGQTGWFQVGGTSVGAPSWAGLLAVADQQRKSSGLSSLAIGSGLTTSPAYAAGSSSYTDVTSGTNGTCGATCTATTGWDLVTGFGSPVGSSLLSTSTARGTLIS
jgi:subtilase family serine protease